MGLRARSGRGRERSVHGWGRRRATESAEEAEDPEEETAEAWFVPAAGSWS